MQIKFTCHNLVNESLKSFLGINKSASTHKYASLNRMQKKKNNSWFQFSTIDKKQCLQLFFNLSQETVVLETRINFSKLIT